MPEEIASQNSYRPSDVYLPLINREATQEDLPNLLLTQASPFLPVRVLREDRRKDVLQGIDSVRRYLYFRFKTVLEESGFPELARKMIGSGRTLDIEEICRQIPDQRQREDIRRLLGKERASLNADFLERLGFIPTNEFDRDTIPIREFRQPALRFYCSRDEMPEPHPQVEEAERHFQSLRHFFPRWFPEDAISHPHDLVPSLTPEQAMEYPIYARLANWITSTNNDFQDCVREAFEFLSTLLTSIAPEGPKRQIHEPVSDLGTKSLAALLEMVLNRRSSLRRRLEALRLLEWSISLFSVKRNPVFQAQQATRRDIHQLLSIEVWEFPDKFPPVKIAPEIADLVYEEENQKGAIPGLLGILQFLKSHRELVETLPEFKTHLMELVSFLSQIQTDEGKSILHTGRKVNEAVERILKECPQVSQSDRVIFSSREKSPFAIMLKVFLYQELARKCMATLQGVKTGLSKRYARQKLQEFRVRMSETHDRKDFPLKPVGIDSIDDAVGFSLAINLSRPLRKYRRSERGNINHLFTVLADYLVSKLHLTDARRENHLWNQNRMNPKSTEAFRVYKIHGNYAIEAEVFEKGRLIKKVVKVPVEIQLYPTESHLRSYFPGETGKEEYGKRKARDIADRLRPSAIGDEKVYSPLDLKELEEFLEMAT